MRVAKKKQKTVIVFANSTQGRSCLFNQSTGRNRRSKPCLKPNVLKVSKDIVCGKLHASDDYKQTLLLSIFSKGTPINPFCLMVDNLSKQVYLPI